MDENDDHDIDNNKCDDDDRGDYDSKDDAGVAADYDDDDSYDDRCTEIYREFQLLSSWYFVITPPSFTECFACWSTTRSTKGTGNNLRDP